MSKGYSAVPVSKMTNRQYPLLESENKKHKTKNQIVKRLKILLKASKYCAENKLPFSLVFQIVNYYEKQNGNLFSCCSKGAK